MSLTEKIKILLLLKGKKNKELAAYLGMTPQSFQNKLRRGSFSAEDLIKIADFTKSQLAFTVGPGQAVTLSSEDIRTAPIEEDPSEPAATMRVDVPDILSLSEALEFRFWAKECLGCDTSKLSNEEQKKIYLLWQESLKTEEE